jgi:SPP1 family predicted phage head-tail adaptor
MLSAGKLNKRVLIEKSVPGSPPVNEFGEPVVSWIEVDTVWASAEPLSGREFWAQQQVQSEITERFRIRYRADILTGMRVVYNSAIYMIKSIIDPLEKHEELNLMCAEGVRIS